MPGFLFVRVLAVVHHRLGAWVLQSKFTATIVDIIIFAVVELAIT